MNLLIQNIIVVRVCKFMIYWKSFQIIEVPSYIAPFL